MDRYSDWTKQQLMLLWFWNRLQEAYEADDRSSLQVQLVRGGITWGGRPMDVHVWVPLAPGDDVDPNVHSRRVSISHEIPELSRGAEAVAVFDRLVRGRYIDATVEPSGAGVFYDLTDKGRIDIGKFPDPDRRLIEAFEAAQRAVEHDGSLTAAERASRLEALSRIIGLLNSVSGLGRQVLDWLPNAGGGGGAV